ncbi:hypothetical protein TSUD_407070 [Trifolium subterraneum]|uniref:SWIM-type domain-containing protein n=1 Tax=Trifolium subterraneum TaxID=3900 RepID=A0A2Z6PEP6_TRISU|nr:hypothetical protein TSUD_407070 [Trifolium subterraneum]
MMFVVHKVDNDNRLERIFLCDGESRKNFEVFSDVLAFDATYRKNKYNFPFVVFSGVNHHNQTIVFATGLVTRETNETEIEADFHSNYGQLVIQSSLRSIKKSTASQYTKEIFNMFKVVRSKCMFLKEKFKCSCLRMESIGLPCDHIVCILVYLDIDELPKCLVLPRWTKIAKESIVGSYSGGSLYWDSQVTAQYSSLVKMSEDVAELMYDDLDDHNQVADVLDAELKQHKAKHQTCKTNVGSGTIDVDVLDPLQVRTKGCGSNPTSTPSNRRRGPTCCECGIIGHNKCFCPNSNIVHHAVTPSPNYDNLVST